MYTTRQEGLENGSRSKSPYDHAEIRDGQQKAHHDMRRFLIQWGNVLLHTNAVFGKGKGWRK